MTNIETNMKVKENSHQLLETIFESDEYAEWVQNNAYDYGYIVCNGDTLIEAMESDELSLAYLRYIGYDGEC